MNKTKKQNTEINFGIKFVVLKLMKNGSYKLNNS